MGTIKPYTIRYSYVENESDCSNNLTEMGIKKFGSNFRGFVKITSWINSDGYVSKKIEPVEGSPVNGFRQAIEDAGLVGFEF